MATTGLTAKLRVETRNAAQFHTAEVQTLEKEFTEKEVQTEWVEGGARPIRGLTRSYPTQDGDVPT